ncbi:Bet1-like protein At4g14600 [Linum grandiflorum]
MAASSSRGGAFYGGATPFRSRQAATSDEIQLRIDPMSADFDDEITGLRSQVKQLRNVSPPIC